MLMRRTNEILKKKKVNNLDTENVQILIARGLVSCCGQIRRERRIPTGDCLINHNYRVSMISPPN